MVITRKDILQTAPKAINFFLKYLPNNKTNKPELFDYIQVVVETAVYSSPSDCPLIDSTARSFDDAMLHLYSNVWQGIRKHHPTAYHMLDLYSSMFHPISILVNRNN